MKTLEHLVDDDPEALVQRLLRRDPQHARELVPERAAAIGLYVRGRQRQADALSRQERTQRVLFGVPAIGRIARPRALDRAGAPRARSAAAAGRGSALLVLGVSRQQILIQQRGLQDLALHWRRRREQAGVDVGEKQGRELDELEVARDAVGDVEFGIQAQLAEAPADRPHALEHLLAQPAEGLVQLVAGGLDVARRPLNVAVASERAEVTRQVGEGGLRRRAQEACRELAHPL